MRRRLVSLVLLGLVSLIVGPQISWAENGDAGQAGAFLTYGAGARGLGMGRAFAGLADDATALYWNPGGLALARQNQAIVQYASLIDGNSFQYLGYDQIFPYIGTLGASLLYFSQGQAEGVSYDELTGKTESTGDFTNSEMAFLLGFGTDITSQLSAGGTVKVVNQTMMNLSSTGFGIDLGLMYRPFSFLNVGLSFQNLVSPDIKLQDTDERFPMNMVIGFGFKFLNEALKADLDVAKNMEQDSIKPRFGLEGMPMKDLYLRTGLDDTEFSLGAGYRCQGFQLDYAVGLLDYARGLQTSSLMHKVSLSYYFGGFILDIKAEPDSFSPVGINKIAVFKIQSQTKFQINNWSLEIVNEAKASVKKYSGEGMPPDHIVWDGLMDNTNPMPDGKYTVILTVEDTAGARNSAETTVRIQSLLPLGVSPVELN
jgi:hypothetical protein